MFAKGLEYIHQNPVVSGFVIKPGDWKYSSAKDFAESKGWFIYIIVHNHGTRSQAASCAAFSRQKGGR